MVSAIKERGGNADLSVEKLVEKGKALGITVNPETPSDVDQTQANIEAWSRFLPRSFVAAVLGWLRKPFSYAQEDES